MKLKVTYCLFFVILSFSCNRHGASKPSKLHPLPGESVESIQIACDFVNPSASEHLSFHIEVALRGVWPVTSVGFSAPGGGYGMSMLVADREVVRVWGDKQTQAGQEGVLITLHVDAKSPYSVKVDWGHIEEAYLDGRVVDHTKLLPAGQYDLKLRVCNPVKGIEQSNLGPQSRPTDTHPEHNRTGSISR